MKRATLLSTAVAAAVGSMTPPQSAALTQVNDTWPSVSYIGTSVFRFTALRSGIHRISITNADFLSSVLDEGCLSIGAYMDDFGAVPLEVQPGSSKVGGAAVVFLKVPGAGEVKITSSSGLRSASARTISPATQPIKNANLGLSGTHSAAASFNPLTSFVHPSLIYFPAGWNGYTYLMTATPWAGPGWPTGDIYEDGLLFSSTDAVTFTPVNINATGFANLTNANATGFAATDCRLAFDPLAAGGAGILYAYQRFTKNSVETLIRQQTLNGTTWTNAAGVTGSYDVLAFAAGSVLAHPLAAPTTSALSPSILFYNGECRMWATMQDNNGVLFLRHWVSLDGLTFTDGETLPIPWTADYQGAWHTDVQYDDDARQFVMLGQLQRKGALGSTYTNINVLYTSKDGRNFRQHPVPLGYTGHDLPTKTQHIYKGCICRVATRRWIFVNSSSTTVGGLYLSLQGPLSIETDRPRNCHPATSVFDEPTGRWFGSTAADVVAPGVFQREPAWSYIGNAGGKASIASGKMTILRNSGQAAIVTCGTRLGLSYRLLMRLRATHSTSIMRVGAESTALTLGLHIEGNVSLLKLAQNTDAGVAYTNDTLAHNWELRREQLSPSAPEALITTGASVAGNRTLTVASSAGFIAGTPMKLIGAGPGGADIDTVCGGAPTGTTVIVSNNMPLTLGSFQVRGTRWKLSAIRDGITLYTFLTTEVFYGALQFFSSGSADLQGWEIDYAYLIPFDAPDMSI
jgi:hypothetical protein